MKKLNNEILCLRATVDDDIGKIAEYLHLTDPYIYPCICKDPKNEDWKKLIGFCFNEKDNVFSLDHIIVAKSEKGDIIGVLCVVPCGKRLSFCDEETVPTSLRGKFSLVKEGYFDPLVEETLATEGYCITNVCVDENFRGRGVGSKLLESCIDECGEYPLLLDVVADNDCAIALYHKYGFEITKEYYGFSGTDVLLPCYQMIRKP